MSETAELDTPTEPPEPPEPEPEPKLEPESESEYRGRCEAETTVGGTPFRCQFEADHEGDHRFRPVEDEAPTAEAKTVDLDRARGQLAKEAERHYKRVLEITGEDAESFHPCELCSPMLAGWREDAAPAEATIKAVRVVIGMPDISHLRMSPWERVCDDCGGATRVRTGSLDPKFETKKCDACDGKGYVSSRPRQNTDAPAAPVAENGNADLPAYDDGVRRDMFGTPEGDPDFEKLPGARIRPTDYWQQNRPA